jgi:iron complex transport system substrate-binding protein
MSVATRALALVAGLLSAMVPAICAYAAEPGQPQAAIDTTRIVSVGGDVTEILYALGKGDRIVAIDTTSQ